MKSYLLFFSLIILISTQDLEISTNQTKPIESAATGFMAGFSSIIVSEIGDKTFLIAAALSLKYNRVVVFGGASAALFVMSALSVAFGLIVPTLLNKRYTSIISSFLFLFFGFKLLHDYYKNEAKDDGEEKEVEEELKKLEEKLHTKKQDVESGLKQQLKPVATHKQMNKEIFISTFSMTFLAEWGDRSQITTIALAAKHNPWIIMISVFLAHCLCSLGAVISGKMLSEKITERQVNLIGGILFMIFGISALFQIE